MPTVKRLGKAVLGLSAATALFTLHCSSPAPAAPGTFSEIYPLIYPQETKAQCNFCHGLPPNEKSNGNLSMGLDKAAAYAALMDSSSTSAKCQGHKHIVPGHPEESLLFLKVTNPPCGDPMPLGGSPLTTEQIELIRSWIADGAKDD